MSKKKWYKLSKSLAIWFPCLQSIIIESLDIQKWEIKRLIKNDFSLGNSTLILTFWSASYLQSDIFGSLNDQGLLSRASEALVAMDMKHPVSSAHQVFPQIKSDMMYSHPAISSSTAAGTSISRSSNQVLILVRWRLCQNSTISPILLRFPCDKCLSYVLKTSNQFVKATKNEDPWFLTPCQL